MRAFGIFERNVSWKKFCWCFSIWFHYYLNKTLPRWLRSAV